MPRLKRGRSERVISKNVDVMIEHPGPRFKKLIKKFGIEHATEIARAAAERIAGKR